MNGLIFDDVTIQIGGSAQFLFDPEIGQKSVPAIIEFRGGEKAYAEISEVYVNRVVIKVGEYSAGPEEKLSGGSWFLQYNKKNDNWRIVKKL